jgi:hypothetical protein
MAEFNPGTFSLPAGINTTMQYGITYALLPVPAQLLAGIALLYCNTYNGTYSPLANSNIGPNGCPVNGGFVKVAASPTTVMITKKTLKQIHG